MLLDEDQHGSYIMNSKDLRAVEYVNDLVKMGVHSLKIEGRTKSDYYIARTAQVYRQAIDDAVAGKPFNPTLLNDLESMANRGFHGGLFAAPYTAGLTKLRTLTQRRSTLTGWPALSCARRFKRIRWR